MRGPGNEVAANYTGKLEQSVEENLSPQRLLLAVYNAIVQLTINELLMEY